MSAWIVSKAHIDTLVTALADREMLTEDPNVVGRMLWRENHRSVNYRYGERSRTPAYKFTPRMDVVRALGAPGVLQQVQCYDYQTCERDDWPRTVSHALTERLRASLKDEIGPDVPKPDYPQYPWGIDDGERWGGFAHDRMTRHDR